MSELSSGVISSATSVGRIDVHSHLLPGVDDGCATLEESLQCARAMVDAGFTDSFCTPHFWPSYPQTQISTIKQWTAAFQRQLDSAGIALRLHPGSEINLRPDLSKMNVWDLPTYGMAGKYALIDLWADRLPKFFDPTVKWMQDYGLTVILAHPERMEAIQRDPDLADHFAKTGVLLQGNLQCLNDPARSGTRTVAEKYLREGRYFMLGSDLHKIDTLQHRLDGLRNAIEMIGEEAIKKLTIDNPRKLMNTQPQRQTV